MIVKPGQNAVTTYFVIRDTADGTATTSVTIANMDLQYVRAGAEPVAKVDATALGSASAGHSENKAFEIDSTDQPGLFRVDWPDAAFATGVGEVILTVKLAGSFTEHLRVELGPPVDVVAVDGILQRATDLAEIAQFLFANAQDLTSDAVVVDDSVIAQMLANDGDISEYDMAIHSQEAIGSQVGSIGTGATGGTHVEASYDNTNRDVIVNGGAADLKGGGEVGIPVTGHSFVVGREVTIANTVSYDGAYEVISQTTNEVVITHAQDAETFGPDDTIVASIKGEIFVGTITAGTFAVTSAPQGSLHSMDDDGGVIKIAYGFNVGGSRQATNIALLFNVDGNPAEMILKAYDFVTPQFEAKRTMPGSGGSTFLPLDPPLVSRNTGAGSELGDVFIFLDTESTTPSSLDVDLCLLTAVGTNVLIGYPNGFEISAAGESGTEFGRNGTAGRPCPFADALVMNAANSLNLFAIHNGETINLGADSDGISLVGEAWTLVLGGTTAGTFIRGANMSGTSTGEGYILDTCTLGATTMDPGTHRNCIYTDTITGFTMGSPGTYFVNDPRSGVAGNTAPVFTWDGSGTSKGNFRAISTGVQFEGMADGDIATVEGLGQFIEGTCPGGAVTIRGFLTTSGITNITLTDEARFDVTQITGGAYSLDTDGNGRIRIVDGVGDGEINTNAGAIVSVETTASNSDMRGTDGVDTTAMRGTDGVDTATMRGTNSAALASVCTETRLAELDSGNIPADIDTLLGRITSTIFSGITSLAEWLGLIAGKQVGNTTARTELRATGAGSGTYDETRESQEATRDRGDTAWITATSVIVSDAGLVRFITFDTLETTAVSGSVAKIAQGSGGGGGSTDASDYTGAFSAAVLVNAPTGVSVILTHTTLEAAPNLAIEIDQNYAWSVDITATVAQTGKEHAFAVYEREDKETQLWILDTGHITVGGTGDKTLTVADDHANTGTTGTFYYELANTTDDVLITAGSLTIKARGDTLQPS